MQIPLLLATIIAMSVPIPVWDRYNWDTSQLGNLPPLENCTTRWCPASKVRWPINFNSNFATADFHESIKTIAVLNMNVSFELLTVFWFMLPCLVVVAGILFQAFF